MTERLVHHGRITTRRRLRFSSLLAVGPGLGWMTLFLLLPGCFVAVLAFADRDADGRILWTFTLRNFERLVGFGIFGWSGDMIYIFGHSLWVALWVTVICLLLAYPLAFAIARLSAPRRWLALGLLIIPMSINLVVRTYAWELLLSPQLPLAVVASWLGLIDAGDALYPGSAAVYVGMISFGLPYAVLPLYTNVERLDPTLAEAAQDLYASRTRVFLRVLLPQTLPGLSVAVLLTFVPAVGMFVISNRLGGGNFMLVGNLIQQQFGVSRDFPFGAAISLVLILLTLAGLFAMRRRGDRIELL